MIRLYWSRAGEILCRDHAPLDWSDTWVREDWQRVRRAELRAWKQATGRTMRCETCGAEAQSDTGRVMDA